MRDTARELPDRLHLLRLPKCRLRALELGDLPPLRYDLDDRVTLVANGFQGEVEDTPDLVGKLERRFVADDNPFDRLWHLLPQPASLARRSFPPRGLPKTHAHDSG